ncbi:hypothetical protein BB560_003456 [Smittium megazygosporum]|uniref:Mitochondrial outer membrane transport complex Sam37/metaxin N-terminal domain-containing protein n=1 Tax=Smittium megazygosporum TaxID=133381 RepID=A0A2T9ZC20_9FUNG|nr:hypothetical protein BB560_003456 [Smittium megazygosporum]
MLSIFKSLPANQSKINLDNDQLWMFASKDPNSPSFDLDCLELQVLLKLSGVDYVVRPSIEPEASPNSKFSVNQILNTSTSEVNKPEDQNSMELTALSMFVESKLKPAIYLTLWADDKVYESYTKLMYSQKRNVLIKPFILNELQNIFLKKVDTGRTSFREEEIIYENAEECISFLSKYLGTNQYFGIE